jgi:hypothetical protein
MVVRTEDSEAEIRLMGLILSQSILVGIAVGIFDAEMWLVNDTAMINGMTYAMGAFFVQGLSYYFFKMFFEQGMQEKARQSTFERERQHRYRGMQNTFDARRSEMEMSMQEKQLEMELQWMEKNPGQMPPTWNRQPAAVLSDATESFNPGTVPKHEAELSKPINLGVSNGTKSDGTPDKRFKENKEE